MTKGKTLAKWSEKEETIFEKTKEEWSRNLELRIPDPNGNFELECDASAVGLGATLRQDGNNVAYISRALSSAERNYGITEREVLAAIWAMEKLQYYLVMRKFKLITDHKAIEEIHKKREFGSPRIQRWLERLGRFSFDPVYRKGKELITSDALSRSGAEDINTVNITELEKEGSFAEKIKEIHIKKFHRRNILHEVREAGIEISENRLKKF
jgi:hypothetical protein